VTIAVGLDDIDAAWLTEVLGESGVLYGVEVAAVEVTPNARWNVAETAFVSADVGGDAPLGLFVKIRTEPDPLEHLFPGEYAFYAERRSDALPLAPCHAALRDDAGGATCLVLTDLRETHTETTWPLPPTEARCHAAMAAFARLHAHGWEAVPGVASSEALIERERQIAAHVDGLLPGFFDTLGDRLTPERRAIFETAVNAYLPLKEARLRDGPVCAIHGDAHFWNLLYPRDSGRGGCVVIDWEDWRVDIGGADLALAMAMHWFPERRARLERALLGSYHDALTEAGVAGYGRDALDADYRLAHLCNAIIPVFQFEAANAHASWWPNLERWFLAFDDLGCRDLL